MIHILKNGFHEIIRTIRQAKAILALKHMRRLATKSGFMSDEEINAAISDIRNGD